MAQQSKKKRKMPWIRHCRKCGKFTSKNGRHDGTHKCKKPFVGKPMVDKTGTYHGIIQGPTSYRQTITVPLKITIKVEMDR